MNRSLSIVLLTLILLASASAYSQPIVGKQSIHFSSGKFQVSNKGAVKLDSLVTALKADSNYTILLEGNTDTVGVYERNIKLSGQRAAAVELYLVNLGISASLISTDAFGPANPVATNDTKEGRKLNRRVDVIVYKNEMKTEPAVPVEDISALYKQLATPYQEFCINPRLDTSLRCNKGSVIHIKANSLVASSNCGNGCVRIRVKEAFLKSDIVLDNLSTTSNGEIIESQGMIYTEALDCQGNKIELAKGKGLVIVIPTDSINAQSKVFKGTRMVDSNINWTTDTNSILSTFSMKDLDDCGGWICGKGNRVLDCGRCAFFFCRIGRLGKAITGVFNSEQRVKNLEFTNCLSSMKSLGDTTGLTISTNPLTLANKPAISKDLVDKCRQLEGLFIKYGVTDAEGLLLAINKPLVDQFKVTTVQQLRDTISKLNRKKIEVDYLNKKISLDDLNYFIYNTTSLGWSNLDCFAGYPRIRWVTVKVNLEPARNIDCKLVFLSRRIVLPPNVESGMIEFRNVPKGERTMIVAIKYENGKPFLALKEVTNANTTFDVEFKELTLEELKEQLKVMNL